MKKIIPILFFAFAVQVVFAQMPPSEYQVLVKRADSLFKAKDYKNSSLTYSSAFKAFGWKALPSDRYNAARSWTLEGNRDSAFYSLERLAKRSLLKDAEKLMK